MIDPHFMRFLEALNRTMIDNGDGTFTIRTKATSGGVANNPKRTPPNLTQDLAKTLYTDTAGVISLNVY